MEQDKQKALAAIQSALMSAEGLDPRTQKAIEKAEGPFRGKVKGIKRNDTIFPNVPDQELSGVMEVGGIDPPAGAVAKIPPALARALGKQLVSHLPDGNIKKVFSALQQKYPRLMGHVNKIDFNPQTFDEALNGYKGEQTNFTHDLARLYRESPYDRNMDGVRIQRMMEPADQLATQTDPRQLPFFQPEATHFSEIRIVPEQNAGLDELANTAAHELTHAAQQLRLGSNFFPEYIKQHWSVGYRNNPFERRAQAGGKRFSDRFMADEALKASLGKK